MKKHVYFDSCHFDSFRNNPYWNKYFKKKLNFANVSACFFTSWIVLENPVKLYEYNERWQECFFLLKKLIQRNNNNIFVLGGIIKVSNDN